MVRTSVPCSSRWTAKACLSECGVIGLGILQVWWAFLACVLNRVSGDVLARRIAGEEPVLGPFHPPPVTQSRQQFRARASRSDPSFPCLARRARPCACCQWRGA